MSIFLAKCQDFRDKVGISGSGPSTVVGQTGMNGKIVKWIADADELIQRKWEDWSFLFKEQQIITATASKSTFTLSDLNITDLAKWKKPSFIMNPGTASYKQLAYEMTYQDWLISAERAGNLSEGEIDRVVIRPGDNALIFTPTPAADTTVWASYWYAVTRMTVDASTTLIPDRFEEAILYRAKMFYAEFEEDPDLYQSAMDDYDEIIEKLESACLPSLENTQASEDDMHFDVIVE